MSDELVAEKILISTRKVLTSVQLDDMELRTWKNDITDGIVLEIRGYILAGCPRVITLQASYPASWWDHFKRDVLTKVVAKPLTPIGYWFRDRVTWKDTSKSLHQEVHAKVCPHGSEQKGEHARWLTKEN